MSGKKKRDIGGVITVDGDQLCWEVRSEPAWKTTDGNVGLRLSIVKYDETKTRHGVMKAWRELILQFPFEKRQHHPSRFPDKPKVTPEQVVAGVRIAMEAGWFPTARGRPFELVLEEGDI